MIPINPILHIRIPSDLQVEFPGRNGFSARNIWNMRDFYGEHASRRKLQPLVAEISWSKNLIITARCKDDLEALDQQARLPEENPPIGVATYTVVPELPEAYREELPSPEAIAQRLQAWSETEASDE